VHRSRLEILLAETRIAPGRFPGIVLDPEDRPTLLQWLKRPEAKIQALKPWIAEQLGEMPAAGVLTTVETEAKYAGYIHQQEKQMARMKNAERRVIPEEFAYSGIPGLSREIQEKLQQVRPSTLGQAGRIPGITPAAVAILDVYLTVTR
jgi:NAD/FAD-utilizing enzyme apparently involved in cell division